ncbi:hypothetical protein AGMMS49545_19310 [Betaproteobacteria bacterium]|nr:hypothetical protein AGMMS49545_19310 [Betaproteobacteria bacterium]
MIFNKSNMGTCEKNQHWFYEKMVFEKNPLDWHFSGHSHRAGVYGVKRECGTYPNQDTLKVSYANDPGLESKALPTGTRFVVSSSAGPIGTQNLQGEFVKVKKWLTGKIEPGEFNNWLLRPPSGSFVDCAGSGSVEQIKTVRSPFNEKPRLCVILDYLTVMNPGKEVVPFQFISARRTSPDLPFANEIGFKISESMLELQCLKLEEMKICVFTAGGDSKNASTSSDKWNTLDIGNGVNQATHIITLSEDNIQELEKYLVAPPTQTELNEFEKAKFTELEAQMKDEQGKSAEDAKKESKEMRKEEERGYWSSRKEMPVKRVLQAFCMIPLTAPSIAGKDDLNCDDPWVFPLEIGILETTEAEKLRSGLLAQVAPPNTDYFQRPYGERGEVPDWWFRAKFFSKKYPWARDVIKPQKDSSDEDETSAQDGDTPSLPTGGRRI